jgi:hypothetical protein
LTRCTPSLPFRLFSDTLSMEVRPQLLSEVQITRNPLSGSLSENYCLSVDWSAIRDSSTTSDLHLAKLEMRSGATLLRRDLHLVPATELVGRTTINARKIQNSPAHLVIATDMSIEHSPWAFQPHGGTPSMFHNYNSALNIRLQTNFRPSAT